MATERDAKNGDVAIIGVACRLPDADNLATALYMEQDDVDVDKAFVDMGLDSVIAVEWIRAINKHYKIKLNVSKVYDYSTIGELSGFLEQEVNKQDAVLRHPPPLNSISLLSVYDVLLQVKQKSLGTMEAEKLLKQLGV